MYATRSHSQNQAAPDENNGGSKADAANKKGAGAGVGAVVARGGKAPSRNPRKALGDIGNVVVEQQQQQQPAKARAKESSAACAAGAAASRRPPRAAAAAEGNNNKTAQEKEKAAVALASIPVAYNTRARAQKAKQQYGTLTALLTAQSEALAREQPSVENIDEGDCCNPLAVTDYVDDIYSFYRKSEVHCYNTCDFLSAQADVNDKMRAILVDWLIEVHYKFKLMPETLFLTVNLIDRYLSRTVVSRKYLQLVGVTSMLLAAKYEEIWAPEVQDFISISDDAYTRKEILDMERTMLNTLSFNLTVPTPYVFLVRFLKAAKSDSRMENLAFYLVELSLVQYGMVKYPPSILAAAAVYVSQGLNETPGHARWSKVLEHHSHYREEQLKECAGLMVEHHKTAPSQSVVYRKYSNPKLSSVSLLVIEH